MTESPENNNRTPTFRRNAELEQLLGNLNNLLSCAERASQKYYVSKYGEYPLIFVMGPHRSGSTLFMQWLAHSGIVAYPTNLLSRFYGAPAVGAQIQLLLTDPRFNFRNEILDFNSPISFSSENGKTQGALAPNEFWYFWRRFLPFGELDYLPNEELFRVADLENLVGELTALTRVFGKPFALKSMILNYNIPFLDAIFKKALFVQLRRDPVTNVASILDARKRQLSTEAEWYSFKIPEYPQLRHLPPISQSAGQLHYINKAVTEGMSKVAVARKLTIDYEIFCASPRRIFSDLCEKLHIEDQVYQGPDSFSISREKEGPNRTTIAAALAEFSDR